MGFEKEKMVEIARFQFPADAQPFIDLLKSEGIDCYLRNEFTTFVFGFSDVGGARIEVLEHDVARAMEIMKEEGYETWLS